MKNYYQLSAEEAVKAVNGSTEPLTEEQVRANQEKYGPNELVEEKRKPSFRSFWSSIRTSLSLSLLLLPLHPVLWEISKARLSS